MDNEKVLKAIKSNQILVAELNKIMNQHKELLNQVTQTIDINKKLVESTKIIVPKISPITIPKITIPKIDPVILKSVDTYNNIIQSNSISYKAILDNIYSDAFIENEYETQESKEILYEFRETVTERFEDDYDIDLKDVKYNNLSDIEQNALLTAFVTVFEIIFSDAINEYFNNEQFVSGLILLKVGLNLILATYDKNIKE